MRSRPCKDFGRGFYLTPVLRDAATYGRRKCSQTGGEPVVNCYYFDEGVMRALKVKKFDAYSSDWLDFVLANRNSPTGGSMHDYDIVVGPVVTPEAGILIRHLEDGDITPDELIETLQATERPKMQYFFGTEKSMKYLKKFIYG